MAKRKAKIEADLPAPQEPVPDIVLYQSPDGTTRFQVRLDQETLRLTQRQLADLFQKDVRTVNETSPTSSTTRSYRPRQLFGNSE